MTVINRRNAVVGYVTIKTGKVVARRKAKQVGSKLVPWSSNGKSSRNGKSKSGKSSKKSG